eukprot:scaffold105435_cov27-Prasinocladus_malaysianus.AAC.1
MSTRTVSKTNFCYTPRPRYSGSKLARKLFTKNDKTTHQVSGLMRTRQLNEKRMHDPSHYCHLANDATRTMLHGQSFCFSDYHVRYRT